MQARIPFLKMHVPELESLPKPQRQEVLAQCAEDPSMRALAKQHMILTRMGQAILRSGCSRISYYRVQVSIGALSLLSKWARCSFQWHGSQGPCCCITAGLRGSCGYLFGR